MLPLAYQLHQLCMNLQRYCYISLYDTAFEKYFTYEGGLTWDVSRREGAWWKKLLHCETAGCRNKTSLDIHLDSTFSGRKHFWNRTFLPIVMDPKHAHINLLRVQVVGHPPAIGSLQPTSTCFNRFVTAPPRRRLRNVVVPRRAVHLRTGFADVVGRISKVVRTDENITDEWLRAACGKRPFQGSGELPYIVSDSPGLLRHVRRLHPGLRTSELPATGEPTRSWFTTRGMKFATYDDVVVAGMAEELSVAPQSALEEVTRRCGAVKKCLVRQNISQISRFQSAITE
ncbi:MAG: hypothetical protein SGPRY_010726, partial [Prymnesium sp.]